MNVFGLMWVEVMLFVIEEIKNNINILMNIILGYDIWDSVNEVQFVMCNVLDFFLIKGRVVYEDFVINRICVNFFVVVVIGGVGLKILKVVVYVLGVMFILQISYFFMSLLFSDKVNFLFFLCMILLDYI